MDATLSNRPRLQPGIPAGGIAAIVVTLAAMSWGLFADRPTDAHGPRFTFAVGDGMVPPAPPVPPAAPRAPQVEVQVDAEGIRSAVREAMRSLDVEAIRRAAEQGRAAAERVREASRAGGSMDSAAQADVGGTFSASFDAPRGVSLVDLTADITVEMSRRADKVRLEVEGGGARLRTSVQDGALTLIGTNADAPVTIRLTLPTQADLVLANVAGDLTISGRSEGALKVDLRRGDITAERVGSAAIVVREAGSISIGRVEGRLDFASHGAADLSVERTGVASLTVNGHSDVQIGRVEDGLTLAIPGHADVSIDRVDGPVKTDFAGAGSVSISEGEASSLQVAVTGAGEFRFDGLAHDPVVLASGVGSVHIARHEGRSRVQNTGQGSAYVGD